MDKLKTELEEAQARLREVTARYERVELRRRGYPALRGRIESELRDAETQFRSMALDSELGGAHMNGASARLRETIAAKRAALEHLGGAAAEREAAQLRREVLDAEGALHQARRAFERGREEPALRKLHGLLSDAHAEVCGVRERSGLIGADGLLAYADIETIRSLVNRLGRALNLPEVKKHHTAEERKQSESLLELPGAIAEQDRAGAIDRASRRRREDKVRRASHQRREEKQLIHRSGGRNDRALRDIG